MIRAIIRFLRDVLRKFSTDEANIRAAALAFYAALSLAPMVMLFISVTGYLGGGTRERMIETVTSTVGPKAGEAVRMIAGGGESRIDGAGLSMLVGIVVVLFSASGVVAALQVGLNRVWNVRGSRGGGWQPWLRRRLLSMAMIPAIGFLLLVSMVLSTVIEMVLHEGSAEWRMLTFVASFLVFVLLFAAMFRVLPDARVRWRRVWFGAFVTAALFAVGKHVVALYIARAGYESRYGAAGSLVAMLVWVYYSAVIVYLGAEITQVSAQRAGDPIEPMRGAAPADADPAETDAPDRRRPRIAAQRRGGRTA